MLSPSFLLQSIPLVMVFFVFYAIVIRPGRVSEGKRWLEVQGLQGGERVLLTCGILGFFKGRHGDPETGEYEIEIAVGTCIRVTEEGIRRTVPVLPAAGGEAHEEAGDGLPDADTAPSSLAHMVLPQS